MDRARAYAIVREIGAHANLETRPSPPTDAFFIALIGGEAEARSCGQCLAGATRPELPPAACQEADQAESEVRDYMIYSGLLWRLRQ